MLSLRTLLFEKRFVKPERFFHGTSAKNLPRIFQLGMVPDSSSGAWKGEQMINQSSAHFPNLMSLEGSYWTDDIGVARGYAAAHRGSQALIVFADIIPQSGFGDEDTVSSVVFEAYETVVKPHVVRTNFDDRTVLGVFHANPKKFEQTADKFANTLHNNLKRDDKMPLDKEFLTNIFKTLFRRYFAHEVESSLDRTKEAFRSGIIEELISQGKEPREAVSIANETEFPKEQFPSIKEGEMAYTAAMEALTRRYRVLHDKDPETASSAKDRRIRIPTNVGFTGRNKITAIIRERPQPLEWEIVYGKLTSEDIQILQNSQFFDKLFDPDGKVILEKKKLKESLRERLFEADEYFEKRYNEE